jgi:hypothetical protein
MIHWSYKKLSLGLICLLFVVMSGVVARDVPSGTISLSTTSMAAGVGAQWGDGTLTLHNGKTYRFAIQGLEVGSGPGTQQTMRNEHGVVINLSSEQQGVKLTLGGQGVRVTLKDR